MYIEPNTTIRILRGVPLDPTYEHTVYFGLIANQTSYFQSKSKYTLDNQSYQRARRGYMRVSVAADNLYDCNYLMFQNTSFGNKWFYAFILGVEYINNSVSEIQYQIDVMQTWHFEYTLNRSFVEREHSNSDNLFENIVAENLDLGDEYICNAHDTYSMNNMSVCMITNRTTQQGTAIGSTVNNIYMPINIVAGVPATDPASMDYMVDQYLENEIIAVYQYPSILGTATTTEPAVYSKPVTPNLTTIDGYTPRNNKLFSYPYNFLLMSNNSGQVANYRWEDWEANQTGLFFIKGVFVSTPAVICYPYHYRGIDHAYDDGLVLSNFPQCPWSGDTFKAWWAQNKASFTTSGISSVLGAVGSGVIAGVAAGAATANPAVGIASAIGTAAVNIGSTVANSVAKIEDIKNTPSQTHGQTQTDSLNPGIGRVRFDFYSLSIKSQYAQIIDDYFDRFGYATKRNKIPNRAARPHWTYTRTVGCTIKGNIPGDDVQTICGIYDKGITFWRNADEVGNYTLDNSVNPGS